MFDICCPVPQKNDMVIVTFLQCQVLAACRLITSSYHHKCCQQRDCNIVFRSAFDFWCCANIITGIERVQALADISRSELCCDSNETRAPINSAQLEGTPLPFLKLHPGPCISVGMWRGTDTRTHRHTDGRDQYTFRLGYASNEV